MHLTVTQKTVGGLATVVVVATAALLIVYDGVSRVVEQMHDLAEVKEPSYSATLEVELNVNGVVMAAFAYLDAPAAHHRERVQRDRRDIAVFLQRYQRLAHGETDRQLAVRLGERCEELLKLAAGLMDTRDQQASIWTQVTGSFERADSIIDTRLPAGISGDDPADPVKRNALVQLESDLAEVGVWLASSQREHLPELDPLLASADEFRRSLRRLRSLPLNAAELRHGVALQETFDRMMSRIPLLLELEHRLQQEGGQLLAMRTEVDGLLDDNVQTLARRRLFEPRQAAETVASDVLHQLRWLIVLVLAIAMAAAVVLLRSISRPIRELKTGAKMVGRGDMGCRIELAAGDEFADVAAEFNRMLERLQATTVSRRVLKQSERRLRQTVVQLQREIEERLRAEAERSQLEGSLRRSETMSAMGALVAGVAHEVRNPLFGILSIVEAMDARFSGRQDFQRYLPALREQSERLSRLMRELLEYGKPTAPALARGSLADVLAEAVITCRPMAERAGVRLVSDLAEDPGPLVLDRARLVRVFANLLENAIQHTPMGGTAALQSREVACQGQRWMECTVTDDGPGFVPEDLPHIFEPFFTRRRGGTGLGLSIVQRIVEEHGGQITAASAEGGGGVITVRLPVPAGATPFADSASCQSAES